MVNGMGKADLETVEKTLYSTGYLTVHIVEGGTGFVPARGIA
jgi:hypothetical protein